MHSDVVFKKFFNKDSLNEIYYKYIILSSATGIDGIKADTKFDIDSEIDIILSRIASGRYKFSKYKEILKLKGAGKKPRVISIPTVRDRIVLKAIHLILQEIYPSAANTLIPQMMLDKVKLGVKNTEFKSFIKVDVKEFYPSIPHEKLIASLSGITHCEKLKTLIQNAISNYTGSNKHIIGVPQGLSISNILAEIYLSDLDKKYKENERILYFRYVDDVLILSKDTKPKALLDEFVSDMKSKGLDCHSYEELDSKTKIGRLSEAFDFLGYEVRNRTLTVKKDNIHRFESSLAKIIYSHKYLKNPKSHITESRLNIRITGCIFEGRRRGWLFYYSQMEDLKVLYKINSTIKKMVAKSSLKIKPKSLVKAYGECSRQVLKNHKYIVNFDEYSTSEKRKYVSEYISPSEISKLDDNVVNFIFLRKIRYLVKELEQDLRDNS
ncbi:reverse transcriptase domain-containing protein [Grimontia hollisae]|uniref:reverse transcriptase domain-containing protein n=1 Tax=Grimontia hollisae TaxID=673 RepID=UPI0023DB1236|nr:reverse transcriptase domain-containing protein [Grimontia hollisae]MDF2183490.1 reverse transcriptase domain-containing protein [Grimontia hollisae]